MDKFSNAFRNFGFKWPYRITPEAAFRKTLAITAGVIVGAKVVNYYYKPMEPFYDELEKGKKALFVKYRQRFDDIKAGKLVE